MSRAGLEIGARNFVDVEIPEVLHLEVSIGLISGPDDVGDRVSPGVCFVAAVAAGVLVGETFDGEVGGAGIDGLGEGEEKPVGLGPDLLDCEDGPPGERPQLATAGAMAQGRQIGTGAWRERG